jgi:hypothetical protein
MTLWFGKSVERMICDEIMGLKSANNEKVMDSILCRWPVAVWPVGHATEAQGCALYAIDLTSATK